MIETSRILQTTAQQAAVIHLKIPKAQIQNVMGPGLGELMAAIAAQGVKPAGAWFDHHFKIADDSWDFEICAPVSAPVAAAGRVKPGQRPAMKVAQTVYHGPYEGLGEAWGEFLDWISTNGHSPAQDLYQCYVAGPESGPDPARWRTELTKPLAS